MLGIGDRFLRREYLIPHPDRLRLIGCILRIPSSTKQLPSNHARRGKDRPCTQASPTRNIRYNMKLDAKEAFKSLLVQHKGDATHPEVNAALEQLVQLAAKDREDNQEWSPAYSMEANSGMWRSITTPPFPGKLPDDGDGKCKFTLGRLSFGMFKPTKLVCAVEKIFNQIQQFDEADVVRTEEKQNNTGDGQPEWKQTYNIQVMMEMDTSMGKLPAKLANYGICFPKSATRLGVIFSSGILEPNFDLTNNPALAVLWKETFDIGIAKEAEAQSYVSRSLSIVTFKVMDLMMGLEPPTYDGVHFTQTFNIGRPYTGHLDIIYLDEDLRVTRGNKGTIVVAERV